MFDTEMATLPGLALPVPVAAGVDVPDLDAAFEERVRTSSGPQLAKLIEENTAELRLREARQLRLAAAWADLHDVPAAGPGELDADPGSAQVERASMVGGDGTPPVREFCVAEFAALQGLSFMSGRSLMADALDVRHRLPELWSGLRAGTVRAWKTRKVADATRALSREAAQNVDEAVARSVEALPWPRFERVLGAAILSAAPEVLKAREVKALTERRVWVSDADHGLKTLVARTDAGDATWFMAAVNRIADILRERGDDGPIGPRRARAIGILAQPAVAMAMLAENAGDPYRSPGEPVTGPDEAPPSDLDLIDSLLGQIGEDPPESELAESLGTELRAEGGPGPWSRDAPPDDDEPDPPSDPQEDADAVRPVLHVQPPTWLDRVPPTALRPRVVLYFHLSDAAVSTGNGLVRPEHGEALSLNQLQEWLRATGCPVQVRPVRIPAEEEPVDGYEIPQRIREAVRLRHVAEAWPWGTSTYPGMDLDHTRAYVPMSRGGPPGQTGVDTLAPLGRLVHRAATFGRWQKRQPAPGVFLWRTPHGWIFVTTNQGTLALGNNGYAHAAWQAAAPPSSGSPPT